MRYTTNKELEKVVLELEKKIAKLETKILLLEVRSTHQNNIPQFKNT